MKNIPKKIYLNLGMDEIEVENVKDFNELREVTWCEDRQSESDIEYHVSNSGTVNWIEFTDEEPEIGTEIIIQHPPELTKVIEQVEYSIETVWIEGSRYAIIQEQTNESD